MGRFGLSSIFNKVKSLGYFFQAKHRKVEAVYIPHMHSLDGKEYPYQVDSIEIECLKISRRLV